jgi:hypothetical protein
MRQLEDLAHRTEDLSDFLSTGIQLDVLAEVPRLKQNDFIRAALRAKTHCTISRLLNANLSMSAKLQIAENRHLPNSLKVSKTKKQGIASRVLHRGRGSCHGHRAGLRSEGHREILCRHVPEMACQQPNQQARSVFPSHYRNGRR